MKHLSTLFLLFCSVLGAEVKLQTFRGQEIQSHLKEMKKLCDAIYCESPYLHNGQDGGYDSYLESYSKVKEAVVCIAYDEGKIVGFGAGMPMSQANDVYKRPLEDHAHDLDQLFYLAEFGLKPEYQGKGFEEKMLAEIEKFVKESKAYKMICLCEIDDVSNPTQKPPGTVVRDGFWIRQGFSRSPHLHFLIFWTNINETSESPHMANYWTKKVVSS